MKNSIWNQCRISINQLILYLKFKNPFRRTTEHNCSYNYLNLSYQQSWRPAVFTKICIFSPSWSLIYLKFKNPFRRTRKHNLCYDYLNLSFFPLEKICWNIMLTFNQLIKDTDCLRVLAWSLIGRCGRRKLSIKKD